MRDMDEIAAWIGRPLVCAALVLAAALVACGMAAPSAAWADDDDTTWHSSGSASTSNAEGQSPQDITMSDIRDVPISELEEADEHLDGQLVQITGEIVGDRMHAEDSEDYCWITVEARDSSYAEIAVYTDVEATELIDTYGNYGRTGTIVQVFGTFNLACPDHEGLSDLHAESLSVVSEGSAREDTLNPWAFLPPAVLVLIGGVLVLVFYRLRENAR